MEKLGLPVEYLASVALPLDEGVPLLRPDDQLASKGSVAGQTLDSSGIAHLKFPSGVQYSGDVVNGLREGRGTLILEDGTRYSGTFEANLPHGQGTISYADGSEYRGDIVYGVRHGQGSFTLPGGSAQYIGEWYEGQRHGQGTLWYGPERNPSKAAFYKGQWSADKRHGRGMLRYSSGNVFVGQWVCDTKQGLGRMCWMDTSEEAVGYWQGDQLAGEGVHTWYTPPAASAAAPASPSASSAAPFAGWTVSNRYIGQFARGYRSGFGTFLYSNGSRYTGEWFADMKHGHGVWVGAEGSVYQGLFLEDRVMLTPELLSLQQAAEAQHNRATEEQEAARGRSRQCLRLTQQPGTAPRSSASHSPSPRGTATSGQVSNSSQAGPGPGLGAGVEGMLLGQEEGRQDADGTESLRVHDLGTAPSSSSSSAAQAAAASVRAAVPPLSSASRTSSGGQRQRQGGTLPEAGRAGAAALPLSPALHAAFLSTLSGGSSPQGGSSKSVKPGGVGAVAGDALFALTLHDLLPSGADMAQWYLRTQPGRAGEVQGPGGRVDAAKVQALGSSLQERAHTGLTNVLLRWNTRLLAWYSSYARCALPSQEEAGGAHACAGYRATAMHTPPTHSSALSDPSALRLQLLCMRSSPEVGSSRSSPLLRLGQVWRMLQDCGVLYPPEVTQASVGELLLSIRRRHTRSVVHAAVRLAHLSAVQSARVAALEYAQGVGTAREREAAQRSDAAASSAESAGDAEASSTTPVDASRPLPAHAHAHASGSARDREKGRGYEEEKKEHFAEEEEGARLSGLTQAELLELLPGSLPMPGGLVLPPETGHAVRYIVSAEVARLSALARAAQDPDTPVLFYEFCELLARLAVLRYRASGGQLLPTVEHQQQEHHQQQEEEEGHEQAHTAADSAAPVVEGEIRAEFVRASGAASSGYGQTSTLASTLRSVGKGSGGGPRYARAAAATNSLLALSQGPAALAARLGLQLPEAGSGRGSHGVTGLLEHHPGLVQPHTTPGGPGQGEAAAGAGAAIDEAHPDLLPLVLEAFLWCGVQPHALPSTTASPGSPLSSPPSGGTTTTTAAARQGAGAGAAGEGTVVAGPSLEKTLNLLPPSAVQHPPLKGSKAHAPREPPLHLPPPPPAPVSVTHTDGLRLAVLQGDPNGSTGTSAEASVEDICASAQALLVGPTGSLLSGLFSALSLASSRTASPTPVPVPGPGPGQGRAKVLPVGEVVDMHARQQRQLQQQTASAPGRPGSAARRRSSASSPSPMPELLEQGPQAHAAAATEMEAREALADEYDLLGPEVRGALAVASAILPLGSLPACPALHVSTGPAHATYTSAGGGPSEGGPPGGVLPLASRPEAPGLSEALACAREGVSGSVRAGVVIEALMAGGLVDTQGIGEIAEEEAIAAAVAAGLVAAPPSWPVPGAATGASTVSFSPSTTVPGAAPGAPSAPVTAAAAGAGAKPGTAASRPPSASSGPPKTASSKPQTSGGPPPTASGRDKGVDRRTPAELAAEASLDPEKMAAARLFLAQSSQLQVVRDRVAALVNEHTLPVFTLQDVLYELHTTLSPPVSAVSLPALLGPGGKATRLAVQVQKEALMDVHLTKPELAEFTFRLAVALGRVHSCRGEEATARAFAPLAAPTQPSEAIEGGSSLVAPSFRADLDAEAQRFYKKQQAAVPPSGPGSEASGVLPGSVAGGDFVSDVGSVVSSVAQVPPASPPPAAAAAAKGGKAPPTPTPSKLAQHAAAIGKRVGALNLFSTGPGGTVDPGLLALTVEEGDREVKRLIAAALGRLLLVATGPAEAARKRTAPGTAGVPFPVATLLPAPSPSPSPGAASEREERARQATLPTDIADTPLQAMSVQQFESVLEVALPLVLGSLQAAVEAPSAN